MEGEDGEVAREREELRRRVAELERQLEERRRIEQALQESEARNRALVAALPDLMFRLTADGTFVDYKAARYDTLAVPPEVFLGRRIDDVLPAPVAEQTLRHIARALASGEMQVYEYPLQVMSDELREFEARLVVSGPDEVTAIIRDISERKQAEERLRVSLEEKELLLREIHHRVKNNLQVISSLLSLQAQAAADEATRELFRDSQHRVRAMVATHEQLYRSRELAAIDLGRYLRDLVAGLFRSYRIDPDAVRLELEVADLSLGVDQAIPCGLIVSELVSNSLKHAFPAGRRGTIRIGLRAADDQRVVLAVADDGVGLSGRSDPRPDGSLGLELVHTLAEQLGASVTIGSGPGTEVSIWFRR